MAGEAFARGENVALVLDDAARALATSLTAIAATYSPVDASPADVLVEVSPPFSTVEHGAWARLVRLWLQHGAPLLDAQPPRDCPACGSSQARPLFTSHDGYPFNECEDCGSWYVPRRIEPALYSRFFDRCPEARELADAGFAKRASDENLAGDLSRIGAYLDVLLPHLPDGNRRYLDIGAGTGSSLVAARDRGLEAVGVEAAQQAFAVAARRGVRMLDATEGLPAGPFGLISLWETLEHLDDPFSALCASVTRLARGGLLAVTVPNLDSPLTRIMRGDCSFVGGGSDGPGHINLMGPRQLEAMFGRAGLSVIHLDGQFSTNFLELTGYLLGRHRGATDLLAGAAIQCRLPAATGEVINSLGPTFALLERTALLSPILMAVACRTSDRPAMQQVVESLRAARETQLTEAADQLRTGVTDYRDMAESLQREVGIRDEMLSRIQAEANGMQTELRLLRDKHPLVTVFVEALRGARNRVRGK